MDKTINISYTSISHFLHCRRDFTLYKDNWRSIETAPALLIGTCVHVGLENWDKTKDGELAISLAITKLDDELKKSGESERTDRESIEDTIYRSLAGYFITYENNHIKYISLETTIEVPLINGVNYVARIDGIIESGSETLVLERKTSGVSPSTFWPAYDMDFQTLGYLWASQVKFNTPISGVMVDLIVKPKKTNEASYDRRYFYPSKEQRDIFLMDLIEIASEIKEAYEKERFYKSYQCTGRYGKCEYFDFCSSGDNERVLEMTHRKGILR